jgi:hypothetical protein
MEQMTKDAFMKELGTATLGDITRALRNFPDATAVVLFRNQNFDSSRFGAQSVIVVGPSNTFKSPEDCKGKWLFDLPSQRQQPVAWCPRAEIEP